MKVYKVLWIDDDFNKEFGRWKTNTLFKYSWDSNMYEINEVILNSLLDNTDKY